MKIKDSYEYIIIGSGFGGAFAAYNLAKYGKEVLIVERGISVRRDDSCWDEDALHLKDHLYRGHTPALVNQCRGKIEEEWPDDTVGGLSTFYGAAAFRMREDDFSGAPIADSDGHDRESAWPFSYNKLSDYYDESENLQFVAGISKEDITEPPRNSNYPQRVPEMLSPPSTRIWNACLDLGLNPFHLPLAMNFSGISGKEKCILCNTCDHFLCKIEAKNDLSVVVLPDAVKNGATLLSNSRAVRINFSNNKAVSIDIIDQSTGHCSTVKTANLILACGALSTPHLLLSSGIGKYSENSSLIGRYLMRHSNGVVSGVFPYKTNPEKIFHKQVAIPDYYFGDPENSSDVKGKWGLIQEIHTPGKGVIKENAPLGLKNIAVLASDYLINLLCISEDMPQYENRVYADTDKKDIFGMPSLMVFHRYTKRDMAARDELCKRSKRILRKAGALFFHVTPIETFSHAIGTCRFGSNRSTSVLNPDCRFWDIDNLYVLDSSFMPSGGSVNPSLTIAANSLRVSEMLGNS